MLYLERYRFVPLYFSFSELFMKRIRNGIILPVILLLIWYLITRMQVFSPYLLPSPGMVWDALTELAASGELVKHLSISLRRVFLGFLLAACTAIPLGILCGRSRYFYTYCWFLLEFLRHVPPLAAIPLIIFLSPVSEHLQRHPQLRPEAAGSRAVFGLFQSAADSPYSIACRTGSHRHRTAAVVRLQLARVNRRRAHRRFCRYRVPDP